MIQKKFTHFVIRFCIVVIGFVISLNSVALFAQGIKPTNGIGLEVSRVTKDGQARETTEDTSNNWSFADTLNLDDLIRYRWSSVALNVKYKDNPDSSGGYLKVYSGDDSKPENLVLDYGSSPLALTSISGKIKDGPNKLVFVYIDKTGLPAVPATKVTFAFNFKKISTKPKITIVSPTPDALFTKGVSKDITIGLQNFALENTDSNNSNKGKLNLYYNEVIPANFLSSFSSSKQIDDTKSEVTFSSKSIDLEKIPDSLTTKLIFVLTKTNGDLLDTREEVQVKTNYQNKLDVGIPRVTILEPKNDRTDLSVSGSEIFLIGIENFELLKERTSGINDGKSGYLQIFIDDAPYKILWPEKSFSLSQIGYVDQLEGRKTVKVQLVNRDFSKLDIDASDSRNIIFTPEKTQNSDDTATQKDSGVKNSNWRVIIIIFTVALIVGGIAILITKG